MQFNINSSIKNILPDFKIGIIHYEDITISDSPQMLKGRIRLFQESCHLDLLEQEVTSISGVQEWRKLFKQLGKDPNRYRPSVEALYRRLKKAQFLPSINSSVDLNNFFSLKYEIPFGIYDLNKIIGNVEFSIGTGNETYEGLNGNIVNLQNLIHSVDQVGPFGSPFIDSKRTPVTSETRQAIHVIYLKPSMNTSEARNMLNSIASMFQQVHGGTYEVSIIS
ncbi:B3/B4 domain-containing protein [Bacillus sp. FJAT-45066]|uniref:B3/B4 domain-containing protein n=1 Tax=Bacillus sp. FJAT-45066 TaxID=2011010 RepID=UPI000BB8A965|nr:phenylalanine--tRNA ligase beta subunit-related protein [Bacillus sp. FJAT-45066]